jgi:hypothetical protein
LAAFARASVVGTISTLLTLLSTPLFPSFLINALSWEPIGADGAPFASGAVLETAMTGLELGLEELNVPAIARPTTVSAPMRRTAIAPIVRRFRLVCPNLERIESPSEEHWRRH